MSVFENEFILVKEYPASEYRKEPVSEEIIEISEFVKPITNNLKDQGFFLIPSKITYKRKTEKTLEDVLLTLSKSKRKKIAKAIKSIRDSKDAEILKERPLSENSFKDWYLNVYTPKISAKKYGIVRADEGWWEKSLEKGEKIGVFLRKSGKIIAGIVARCFPENEYMPKRISISFSAAGDDLRKTGINEYLNAEMIVFANSLGYSQIYRGKDTNLYGKRLSPGISVFKTSLGYEPVVLKRYPDALIKFNNLDDFGDTIFFLDYSEDSEKLTANLILKKEAENTDKYKRPFFRKLRLYVYEGRNIRLIDEFCCCKSHTQAQGPEIPVTEATR